MKESSECDYIGFAELEKSVKVLNADAVDVGRVQGESKASNINNAYFSGFKTGLTGGRGHRKSEEYKDSLDSAINWLAGWLDGVYKREQQELMYHGKKGQISSLRKG